MSCRRRCAPRRLPSPCSSATSWGTPLRPSWWALSRKLSIRPEASTFSTTWRASTSAWRSATPARWPSPSRASSASLARAGSKPIYCAPNAPKARDKTSSRARQAIRQFGKRADDERRARAERVEDRAGAVDPGGLHADGLGADNIERVGGDQPRLADSAHQAAGDVAIGSGRGLVGLHRVNADDLLEVAAQPGVLHQRVQHLRRAIGEDGQHMPGLLQPLQPWLHIIKRLQPVILGQQRVLLRRVERVAARLQRVVERSEEHLREIFVALHRGQAKGELQLPLPPHLRQRLPILWELAFQLLRHARRINQRAIHIKGQRLSGCHALRSFPLCYALYCSVVLPPPCARSVPRPQISTALALAVLARGAI